MESSHLWQEGAGSVRIKEYLLIEISVRRERYTKICAEGLLVVRGVGGL